MTVPPATGPGQPDPVDPATPPTGTPSPAGDAPPAGDPSPATPSEPAATEPTAPSEPAASSEPAAAEDETPADPRNRELARRLLREFAAMDPSDPRRRTLRDQLVRIHLPIVEYIARRFYGRGEPHNDLVQVGSIGLLNAIDRFEPERGLEFTSYATPTIVGEIKRHFRDKGWMVRVPRRLQELRTSMNAITGEMTQQLGRSPTVAELSQRLDATEDEIVEALETGSAYSPASLEAQLDPESGWTLADSLGSEDAAIERIEYREALKPLLAALGERERRILMLRFFQNKTQSQIAAEVGLSQMHISRLLAKTLTELRGGLTAGE